MSSGSEPDVLTTILTASSEDGIRTRDFFRIREMLYQLNYLRMFL